MGSWRGGAGWQPCLSIKTLSEELSDAGQVSASKNCPTFERRVQQPEGEAAQVPAGGRMDEQDVAHPYREVPGSLKRKEVQPGRTSK